MVSSSGFTIGVIGGLLDFASATNILLNQGTSSSTVTTTSTMMATTAMVPTELGLGATAWALILFLLGVLVIATAILSVTTVGARFVLLFSVLMVVYGVVMILVGGVMSTGGMLSTGISMLYGYGMVGVGALMIVNGAMMLRRPMNM